MNNEMMNRVDQLEERLKWLESELVRTKSAQKTSIIRILGEGLLHLVFGVVVVGPIIAIVFGIITWIGEK
ncbi:MULTISPECIES: hypothetical protein [Bacillus]|uniref:Group-specific protein n=2 Tax=Bacillus cereus group TaxID=86661 RepID=A0A2C1D9Z3_BACCE|nr:MULTISPECIES: hypothetical protein [Bacillus cereus group]OFD81962.1 hypothetical protein BWGOE8_15100 [Bacillus mycoides]OFD82207.1 hypothetical protein BWGOE9_14780 [Bacillus mycoides]OFD84732.1 hypothetical protein BWGOE10_14920 [Bacillus mycoides]PGT03155.1 hypothetical protein COD09_10560 [Bacillus cereus]